jgi:hypothetical protein
MKRAAPYLLALALSGCAADFAGLRTQPTPPPPGTAERLLASIARFRSLDEVALATETARMRPLAQVPGGDFARVETALLLMLALAADESEILSLLAPIMRVDSPAEPDLRAMAGFLQVMAVERRTLKENTVTAQAKAREERREAQSQRARAEAQQERADRLQQKLDALTNLEKSLAKRRQSDDPNRRPR